MWRCSLPEILPARPRPPGKMLRFSPSCFSTTPVADAGQSIQPFANETHTGQLASSCYLAPRPPTTRPSSRIAGAPTRPRTSQCLAPRELMYVIRCLQPAPRHPRFRLRHVAAGNPHSYGIGAMRAILLSRSMARILTCQLLGTPVHCAWSWCFLRLHAPEEDYLYGEGRGREAGV